MGTPALITVKASGALRAAMDGVESAEVPASTIRELLNELARRYPKLEAELDKGVAVAIDGEIYRDVWHKEIPPCAEVFLVPRIQGG